MTGLVVTGFVVMGLVPLIADIGDVIGILVFIVIGLMSLVGQIMNKANEDKQKPGPRPGPRPQPGKQQGPLANEIDEFVRQAAQRRAEGRPQPAAQRQVTRPQPAARRPTAAQPLVEAVSVELLQPLADENLKKHTHRVSDQEHGQESSPPSENADESGALLPPTAAASMAAMLIGPTNIRQAIVWAEILKRPEDRWG